MHDKTDTINLYKMCKQLAEMIGTNAQNVLKLGKVVEKNTHNLNVLATNITSQADRVLELEKRLNDKK